MRTIDRPFTVAAAVACITLGACTDSPTEPGESWVALETEAALRIDAELPTLPHVLERVRSRDPNGARSASRSMSRDLERAGELWSASRDAAPDSPVARRLREHAYRIAVDELAAALDTAEVSRMRNRLGRWFEAAAGMRDRVPSRSERRS